MFTDFKKYGWWTRSRLPNKKLRQKLMKENPHCYYCGILVIEEPNTKPLKKGEYYPPNTATIDHLYDRFDPERRYQIYYNEEDKVLSCYDCNQKRAAERIASLPKEMIAERIRLSKTRKKGQIRALLFYPELANSGYSNILTEQVLEKEDKIS